MTRKEKVPPCPQDRQARPLVRALCCECGNIRRTSTYGGYGEPDPADLSLLAVGWIQPTRCTVWRKCAVCKTRTCHAYLRDDLPPSERPADTTMADRYSPFVTELIERLEACGVRVWWEPADQFRPGQIAVVKQWLDDNRWHVELNSAAHVVHLAGALEGAWSLLATAGEDIGGDGWRSVSGIPDDEDEPPYRYRVIRLPR